MQQYHSRIMNTSLTIDIPEVALFDKESLKQMLTTFVKTLAKSKKGNATNSIFVTNAESQSKLHFNWRDIHVSPQVMDMTFQNRVDLGTNDYKEMLSQSLEDKYL